VVDDQGGGRGLEAEGGAVGGEDTRAEGLKQAERERLVAFDQGIIQDLDIERFHRPIARIPKELAGGRDIINAGDGGAVFGGKIDAEIAQETINAAHGDGEEAAGYIFIDGISGGDELDISRKIKRGTDVAADQARVMRD